MADTIKNETVWMRFGVQMMQVGLILVAGAFILAIMTIIFWIQQDAWPQWSASDFGYIPPDSHQASIDQLVARVYHLHLGIVALFGGVALLLLGHRISEFPNR